jgi:hypothetical protein
MVILIHVYRYEHPEKTANKRVDFGHSLTVTARKI